MNHPFLLGLLLAALGLAVGGLLGFAGPLITLAVVAGVAGAVWALTNLEIGLWAMIAVIALLPFGALPVKIVVTPTFLDLAMAGVLVVYLAQWMAGKRHRLTITPAHGLIVAFVGLAVVSFVAGMNNGPLTPNLLRHFAELLLSIGFVVIVVDHVQGIDGLERLARVILLCGLGAAAIGIGLYLLPEELSNRLLSALRVFNYPSGAVLRYVEDNPENAQRAIATSVDPNVLGGLLAMVAGLAAPQWLARRPLLGGRWLTLGALALVLMCLILTFSRGAMLAAGVAGVAVALFPGYRKFLWVIVVAALLVAVLPVTRDYVLHFVEGVRGEDLATQMRFGEYKDAFTLIGRYPFGVGFAGAPDIDIYLGVSNAYLVVAEQMGVAGLLLFLAIVGTLFAWGLRHWPAVKANDRLTPLWLGLHAGLVASLVVGVFDHYFFNLDFQPAGTIFWLFAGLCLAATRLAGRGVEGGAGSVKRDA